MLILPFLAWAQLLSPSYRRVAFPPSMILKVRAMDLSQEAYEFYGDLELAGADGVFGDHFHGTFWSQADLIRLT